MYVLIVCSVEEFFNVEYPMTIYVLLLLVENRTFASSFFMLEPFEVRTKTTTPTGVVKFKKKQTVFWIPK